MIELISFLCILPTVVSYDGCINRFDFKCGTQCTDREDYCICGGSTQQMSDYSDEFWCCTSTPCEKISNGASCPNGTFQPLIFQKYDYVDINFTHLYMISELINIQLNIAVSFKSISLSKEIF